MKGVDGEGGRLVRGGTADVVYVLCLMQAAFVLLAALGEMLLMGGNPSYVVVPIVKMVLLFVLATKVVSGRRWALIGLIVVQSVTVAGFWLQVVAGLLPQVDFTINLVVLLTNVAMPVGVVWLCGLVLARLPRRVAVPALPPPQDPYAPAPLVTAAEGSWP